MGRRCWKVLENVTAEEASRHPIAGAHSIWEITLHVIGAYQLVLRRMQGDSSPLTLVQDWPPVPAVSRTNWEATLRMLRRGNEELRRAVLRFSADRLDLPLAPEPEYSAYTQFIGITQHDVYHAGQITLLRRALQPGNGEG